MPTNDDLLFAEHAVRGGFLSREEVEETLAVQRRMDEMGVHDSLRNVLVNRGVLREGDAAIISRQAGLHAGREPIPGYTLEARLGTGAMGSVYKAWQKGMKRHVAVKILRRDLTSDPRQVERLRREAELVGKLDHPNIVRGLDSGESEGLVWFAMEYVEGETLRERMTRLGPMPADEAVRIVTSLVEAVAHASSQGVVHRDIKPGNVLVDRSGVARLADYGLAKGQSDDALTQIDATLGTPQYVAPEQARNPRDADVRSDIYSLGATFYAMLTGRPPFDGETITQTLTKVLYERPAPLRQLAPQVPETVAYVVERMMAKDRRHRYASPEEVLADLRSLEAGRLSVPSGFSGDIGAFVEGRRRRRAWIAAAGVVAAGTAAAFAAKSWQDREDASRRERNAATALASIRAKAGPEEAWTGATVSAFSAELAAFAAEHEGTRAAADGAADLARWRRQEERLRETLPLAGAASSQQDPDWPSLVRDIAERRRAISSDPDGSVARRRLDEIARSVEARRAERLAAEVERLRADTPAASLKATASRWSDAARDLSRVFFGSDDAPQLASVRAEAARFAEADRRLEAHWDAWSKWTARDALGDDADFRAATDAADACAEETRSDARLRELLHSLPGGERTVALPDAREREVRERLARTSSAAWTRVRSAVEELRAARMLDKALEKIDEHARRAPPPLQVEIARVRAALAEEKASSGEAMRDATAVAARRFFDAIGARDLARARAVADELDAFSARGANDGGAVAFTAAARHLAAVAQRDLWERVASRIAADAASGGGYTDRRNRIRYANVADVRVQRMDLRFTWAGSQTWTGSLADLELDDLLRVASLARDHEDEALLLAALRLTHYSIPDDPRRGAAALAEVLPLLDAAEGRGPVPARGAALVPWLRKLHGELVETTQAQAADAERTAADGHREALEMASGGRHAEASVRLRRLLDAPRLRITDYVTRRRAEIRRQIDDAERAVAAAGFASRFPGAKWTERADGTAELAFDFEDPLAAEDAGRATLGSPGDAVQVATEFGLEASVPSAPGRGPLVPLRANHVLRWRAAEGGPEPRDCPLRIAHPFVPRKRIETSFLLRSDEPYFMALSVSGTVAGVLSDGGSRFGGRGITIWNAADLDRPDRAFDDRTRTSWLEAHPEALRKEGDTRFFQFEPGRLHRVRFVRDEQRAQLFVDGRLRLEGDVRQPSAALAGQVVLLTYGDAEIDDLRISGVPDPDWGRK